MRELERDPARATATADPTGLPPLAVIGAGRAGGALAAAARRAGLDVRLAGRDDAVVASSEAEIALICVPDAGIGDAAAAIAAAVPPPRFAGHVSGASGLDALQPLADAGAETFTLHPLQTIPAPDAELAGTPCAVAGSTPRGLALAKRLGTDLGMRPFALPDDARGTYHAAASIASNFLVALEESATALLARAGVADARELLAPLVLRSAANWAEGGASALTGPIARGDEATVARHLEAIDRVAPELRPLYEALAERTRALARDEGAR